MTEVLDALNLGDRLVGATRYCTLPDSSSQVVPVGGYLDVNLEALVGLQPDLVIVIQDHSVLRARLESLGLATLQVEQGTLAGILRSVVDISEACGVPERGDRLLEAMEARLSRVAAATAGLQAPRALVVVGRDVGTGIITSVWVAGRATYYDDVLRLAGATNAATPSAVAYPELSREGLLHLDPDVVLDLLPDLADRGVGVDRALDDWRSLQSLRAVGSGRLFVLEEPWAVVPGPRVVDLVERVAGLLHPEAHP